MQVTKEVNEVIVAAIEYARENKHEYVTAEHILYKCTFIEKVQNAMEKCGADIENLRKRDLHQEAIVNLMCKELVSFVKDIDEKQRFNYLVKNFNALTSNILLSYQSYTENGFVAQRFKR